MADPHPPRETDSNGRSPRRSVPHPAEIYDPVARSLDVIGDRWSLVLVRHLLLGPKGFSELRQRTGIAPRVLSSRLRDLTAKGFIEARERSEGSGYKLTERGRSLEPIVSSIARWFTRHGIDAFQIDTSTFTETSPQSILESLPFLLREDRARDTQVTFEIRLSGDGGGVFTVQIENGHCDVRTGFAEHADVRYTADSRVWCAMALGLADARDLVKRGLVVKDGGAAAMDHYFYQIHRSRSSKEKDDAGSTSGRASDDRDEFKSRITSQQEQDLKPSKEF
jgi:DNA-binding HxlR family transcriptional regulator